MTDTITQPAKEPNTSNAPGNTSDDTRTPAEIAAELERYKEEFKSAEKGRTRKQIEEALKAEREKWEQESAQARKEARMTQQELLDARTKELESYRTQLSEREARIASLESFYVDQIAEVAKKLPAEKLLELEDATVGLSPERVLKLYRLATPTTTGITTDVPLERQTEPNDFKAKLKSKLDKLKQK